MKNILSFSKKSIPYLVAAALLLPTQLYKHRIHKDQQLLNKKIVNLRIPLSFQK